MGHTKLAAALEAFADGAAIDHVAYTMPVNTPARIAEHGRARDCYERARALLSEA